MVTGDPLHQWSNTDHSEHAVLALSESRSLAVSRGQPDEDELVKEATENPEGTETKSMCGPLLGGLEIRSSGELGGSQPVAQR